MRRRVIALVAALLLAGIGTFVLVGFVRGAADRATAGEELATVYIVSAPITKGTPADQIAASVVTEKVPVKVRSAEAITDLAALEGLVANVDLVVGEQLIASRFVLPAEADLRREDLPTRRVEVPEGMLEVPVRLEAEQALGGIIDAGDTVAVIASFQSFGVAGAETIEVDGDVVAIPETAEEGDTGGVEATHILIENALVVEVQAESTPTFSATDEEGVASSGGAVLAPATNFIITFALPGIDVERLVFAAQYGELWLAAQTPDDVGPTDVITMDEIFQN